MNAAMPSKQLERSVTGAHSLNKLPTATEIKVHSSGQLELFRRPRKSDEGFEIIFAQSHPETGIKHCLRCKIKMVHGDFWRTRLLNLILPSLEERGVGIVKDSGMETYLR